MREWVSHLELLLMLEGLVLGFLQLARFPNLLVPVAEAWERNQMRLFKAVRGTGLIQPKTSSVAKNELITL